MKVAPITQEEAESTPSWYSMIAVMWSQTQNAFNDNLVKFVLVALATATVAHTWVGQNIEIVASSMIPLPFILLAPVAGWMADRFSKRSVMIGCVILQVALLIWMAAVTLTVPADAGPALTARHFHFAMAGFVLLSIQSTLYSPAKLGIAKELVGSSRVGSVAGWMSMTSMVGILAGMILGGRLFAWMGERTGGDPWRATGILMIVFAVASLLPLAATCFVRRTPQQGARSFTPSIFVEHFGHLRILWRNRQLSRASVSLFLVWFVAYLLGMVTIAFGKEMHGAEEGASFIEASRATVAAAQMYVYIGVGLMAGSLLVALLSRKKIPVHLAPVGFLGVATGVALLGWFDPGTSLFTVGLLCAGFFSGFVMAPMGAFLQDESDPGERGRILSANNLQISLGGIFAGAFLMLIRSFGFGNADQMKMVVPIVLIGLFYSWLRLPQSRRAS